MEEWAVVSKNRIIQRFTIEEGQTLTIGRGSDADVIINNSSVSRLHSSLELKNGFYFLSDLKSKNGTRINGEKILAETQISKTDEIVLGKFILKPAMHLGDEVDASSVAATDVDMENFNQTLYVSGLYKGPESAEVAPETRLLSVLEGEALPKKLTLSGKTIMAGKKKPADLVIPGVMMAKIIFFIEHRPKGYFIIPKGGMLCSVKLNDKKLSSERLLKSMDVIAVGETKIRFS